MARVRNYEALARAAYEAAMDTRYNISLRQYYANLALWADKKAKAQRDR